MLIFNFGKNSLRLSWFYRLIITFKLETLEINKKNYRGHKIYSKKKKSMNNSKTAECFEHFTESRQGLFIYSANVTGLYEYFKLNKLKQKNTI